MSGELHEVSLAIGRLQASVDSVKDGQDVLFAKVDAVHGRVAAVEQIRARVDRIEPLVDEHEKQQQQARGRATLFGAGAGALVTAAIAYLKAKFGGGAS